MIQPKKYDTHNYCEKCEKFYKGKSQRLCPKCGEILRYKPRVSHSRKLDYVRY